ncbi:hypothetical protein NC651_030641 [Populus alba x Populus x berolinensis]|nr:hypothetical protein NC651_030641 [Populus alba x Populus x berolinensis]
MLYSTSPTPGISTTLQTTSTRVTPVSYLSVESPSHSFRSYSVSSSDNEGRCSAIANCITRKLSLPPPRANSTFASSSKVTPQPSSPIKLAFPLAEFAFVTILGKLNVKSCSYFFSNGPPLLVLIFPFSSSSSSSSSSCFGHLPTAVVSCMMSIHGSFQLIPLVGSSRLPERSCQLVIGSNFTSVSGLQFPSHFGRQDVTHYQVGFSVHVLVDELKGEKKRG